MEVIFSRIPNLPSLIEALRGRRQAKRKIGEILTEDHAISENQLTRALEKQKSDPRKLGQILVDLGLVSKEELRQSLEKQARHCLASAKVGHTGTWG